MPLLSIVLETFNAQKEVKNKLAEVLEQLKLQTYPQEKMEILIAIDPTSIEMISFLNTNYPQHQLVLVENSSYNNLKYFGLKAAKGDFVALLDSDCIPSLGWAQSIVDTLGSGIDFVAGKTRYSRESWLSRLFSIFSFGDIYNNSKGEANRFAENNVAFSRAIVDQFKYDDRRKRYFGSSLISNDLKSKNYKFVYNPKQATVHFDEGLINQFEMRFRSGHDAVMVSRNDTTGVVPETKYLKFGLAFPFIIAARRIVHDLYVLSKNKQDLDISLPEVPLFLVGCVFFRLFEIIPGVITIIHPTYLKKKYDW